MMQALWNGEVIAESEETVVVEGNHYFPNESVKEQFLEPSETTSYCGWKGDCNYYSLNVGDQTNTDAVWYYGDPFPKAEQIRGHMAFWKGVTVREK